MKWMLNGDTCTDKDDMWLERVWNAGCSCTGGYTWEHACTLKMYNLKYI